MANNLNWSPGHNGKGNFYKSGNISTWNVDASGSPHHQEVAAQDGEGSNNAYLGFLFYITPEGGVNDGGVGFMNNTPMTDDQVIATIEKEDPYLWDGREAEPSENPAGPRVETPGGYGHAYNLMSMSAVDKSNWPDCHAELKVPAFARRRIRKWVDRLKWPEGSERDDARQYHITILSIDTYDDDFVDWMKSRIKGRSFHFKSTGMSMFGPDNDTVVLRLDCPEWSELVKEWEGEANDRDLNPRTFGEPKAHITVGKSPDGKWPQGIPDPHIEFDTSKFNINKNSGWHEAKALGATFVLAAEETPGSELKAWLDTLSPAVEAPPSIHHDNTDQIAPQTLSPASQGHFVDPPSHPYKPYNWADEGDYSQMDRTADVARVPGGGVTDRVEPCPVCNNPLGVPCNQCGYDNLVTPPDFKAAEADWYNRAWKEPGKARPFPDQEMHWRQDHATDVKYAGSWQVLDQHDI